MTTASTPILLRADASTAVGSGHVMRSWALAQAWHGPIHLAAAELPSGLRERLTRAEVTVHDVASADDAGATLELARRLDAAAIVIDGYRFDGRYESTLVAAGKRVLAFDDHRHTEHQAQIILNQNLGASRAMYDGLPDSTRVLCGSRYACLRHEFTRWRGWRRSTAAAARRVLVVLGGTDARGLVPRVVKALAAAGDLEVTVAAGSGTRGLDDLRKQVDAAGFRLVENAADMSELMVQAELAIAGAGATTWELMFLGVPSLLVIVAENQRPGAEAVAAAGVGRVIGNADDLDESQVRNAVTELAGDANARERWTREAQRLVDGFGAERVCAALRSPELVVRPVVSADCEQVFAWANDPEVRAASFSRDPIPWETHVRWFSSKFESPRCRFFVGTDTADAPVGQVRFEIDEGGTAAEIHVAVGSARRGAGMGTRLIAGAVEELFLTSSVQRVEALVKPDNPASMRAFERAGFSGDGKTVAFGQPALRYHRNR